MISRFERPTHQVGITGTSGRTTVTVDGHELRACTSAVLRVDSETVPTLKLALIVLDDLAADLPAFVVLDDKSRAALQTMGWTPPQAEEA